MSPSIQKFTPPSLPGDLIQRSRLESMLMDGLKNKARLFLISAPAGYGKSTLIANWASGNNIEHLWFNLDYKDNDLPVFVSGLREALQIDAPVQPTQRGMTVEEAEEISLLVRNIQKREKTFLLVFDRLDDVSNTRIQDFLFELATQLNPRAVVVLISRRQPELQVSRMRAYNQLVEINEGDLKFNPQEIKEFLQLETGKEIPARNLKSIERKTRGWAAGLRLAVDLLDMELLTEDSPGIAHLNGAQRFLADYFEEEVFGELEPSLQDFLLHSSVLDQFSTALCRSAVKNRGTETLMQQLLDNHLFIFPVENRPGWYSYHPLFRDFLLSRCAAEEQQGILFKAAMWFEQQGFLDEAVDCILRTGQESNALQIIEPACEQAILNGNLTAILQWLAEWSRIGFQPRSELLVYQGWIKALEGDFVQALMLAERAEDLLKTSPIKGKDKERQGSQQITRGKLAALRAFTDVMYTRQYDSALKQAKTAQHLLPKNRSAWNLMALWAQAETQKRIDHIGKSIETLYEGLRIGKTVGGKTFYYAIANSLVAALHFNGQRGEAVEICQKALQHSANTEDPALGGMYSWQGRLALEANQLEEAQQLTEHGLALTQKSGVTLNLIFSNYYASQVYHALGKSDLAMELIHQAQKLAGNASLSDESWLNAWETHLNLAEGNMLKVEHWVRREKLILTQKPDYINMESLLVYTRYLIKNGEFSAAGKLLREMEKQSSRRGYYRWLINIYLQQAVVWEQSEKHNQALDCVKRAVHIAAPEEYQRVFLEEPAPVLKLVPELSMESPAFIMRLLRNASAAENGSRRIPASILPEALSDREMEVLKLLAAGRKGPQIASELFISYSTVRTHLKSIHRKLDVHGRQELLEKARLLELI